MEHALHLVILLVATRLAGELFDRAGQPAAMGEIADGIGVVFVALLPFSPAALAAVRASPLLEVAA